MTLVFHQAALGDFILTWPLLRRLRGAMGERVGVVTHASMGALALHVLDADVGGIPNRLQAHDIERPELAGMWREGGPTSVEPPIREAFDAVERVISYVSDGGDAWARSAQRLMPGAERIYVQPRPPEGIGGWRRHVTLWHEEQLLQQGVRLGDARGPSGIHTPPGSIRRGDSDGPVIVHPGSGGSGKCWPRDRYEAVMDSLLDAGRRVVAVLGEVEAAGWPPRDLKRWASRYETIRSPRLTELADLLQTASLYLGNDAGPTHLAAQLATPTLALFGPSSPHLWHPLGPRVRTLQPPHPRPMHWLSIQRVLKEINTPFP